MEVRLSFTVSEYGRDPENGERFLDAFMAEFPEGGPSISQNFEDGTLTITFALDADDAKTAVIEAVDIFGRGASATGLDATDVVDIEASVVPSEQAQEADPEPVPA